MFRRRVISSYSRDISYMYSYVTISELLKMIWNCETGRGVMMFRYGSRTGFLVVLAPPVSIKDRSLWQC